ncbi:hypothetical protein HanXRQr2_Chr12g0554741 [Helianthus annuus]|uniref:Uncharacterized protein n=1 Tax=Helianthus annuus TaxID=4232 RepID=A0A9K3MX97_HELAN|nr:hypothetical protein HanXRQr2_Chr12g0554741 [Helianthus annuus]KAJ0863790.1 hypothetical protein HanPSC8_Chr12g0534151 [Helianthus annuus]
MTRGRITTQQRFFKFFYAYNFSSVITCRSNTRIDGETTSQI